MNFHYNNQFAQTRQSVFGMPARQIFDVDMNKQDIYYEVFLQPQAPLILPQAENDLLDPKTAEIRKYVKQLIASVQEGKKTEIDPKQNNVLEKIQNLINFYNKMIDDFLKEKHYYSNLFAEDGLSNKSFQKFLEITNLILERLKEHKNYLDKIKLELQLADSKDKKEEIYQTLSQVSDLHTEGYFQTLLKQYDFFIKKLEIFFKKFPGGNNTTFATT